MTDIGFTPEVALALWRQALATEIGLAIATDDTRWLERRLYSSRQEAAEPELWKLIMVKPPNGRELWLVKKAVEMDIDDPQP